MACCRVNFTFLPLLPELIQVIQNTAFSQKNGIQSERIHNKFYRAALLGASVTHGSPAPQGVQGLYVRKVQRSYIKYRCYTE